MSRWFFRKDTRKNDMAHGITFYMWERKTENSRGEAAYNAKKLHLDGFVSLTIADGQWKYGTELIGQVFTKEDGNIFERRADGYNRIQIYFGKADIQTAEMLEQIAKKIRVIKEREDAETIPTESA